MQILEGWGHANDLVKARKVIYTSHKYAIEDNILYKVGYSQSWLRCLGPDDAEHMVREVHEEDCVRHPEAWVLVGKILKQGYYWTTLQKDTQDFVLKCD